MRKIATTIGLATVLAGTAAHAQGYGMSGCGLGSILFGKDNTKLMQILAATTNATFGSQTFGITSGTSNCVSGGVVKLEREQVAFAEVNFQDLKRNMAAGGGEFLSSFSTLLGCTEEAKPAFHKMAQERYESVVASEETTPVEMLRAVKAHIKSRPALAGSCSDERALARAQGRGNVAAAKPDAGKAVR